MQDVVVVKDLNPAVISRQLEKFALSNEPVDFQITKHVMNLIAAFHPLNQNQDIKSIYQGLKPLACWPHEVITELLIILSNPQQMEFYIDMYGGWPMEFRCAQIVQHFGVEKMTQWLKLFYGKEV